jgi:hypothetical protein
MPMRSVTYSLMSMVFNSVTFACVIYNEVSPKVVVVVVVDDDVVVVVVVDVVVFVVVIVVVSKTMYMTMDLGILKLVNNY